jgi:hypothetical protein
MARVSPAGRDILHPCLCLQGDPSLRLNNGSAGDDSSGGEMQSKLKLSHYFSAASATGLRAQWVNAIFNPVVKIMSLLFDKVGGLEM